MTCRRFARLLWAGFCLASLAAAGPSFAMDRKMGPQQQQGHPVSEAASPYETLSFASLKGWHDDDHRAALAAFLRLCAEPEEETAAFPTGAFGIPSAALIALCPSARHAYEVSATRRGKEAQAFFETNFTPVRLSRSGFVTGYFEPEFAGAREKSKKFSVPLLRAPEGLVALGDQPAPQGWPQGLTYALKTGTGYEALPDRGAVMDGALDDQGLELVWLSPIDAFFVHVQGSARIRMTDGSVMRVGFAGKTGYPYTSIARVLVQRGEGSPEDFTMKGLRAWLVRHPDQVDDLLRRNRSYIFFRELKGMEPESGPVGAAGVSLVAKRSLAVDKSLFTFGLPVFVSADLRGTGLRPSHFNRLLIADDTGSAITGPARGDIFVGSGKAAGEIAGNIRHHAVMTLLVPNAALPAFREATSQEGGH